MATYAELSQIRNNAGWDDFLKNVEVACFNKATTIINDASPTQASLLWAEFAFRDGPGVAERAVQYVVLRNKASTIAEIIALSDNTIQLAVNSFVEALYD